MFKAFEFCLPTNATKVPTGPEWLHEIKHDGFRIRAERDGDRVRLITRGGYDWTKRYPWIAGKKLPQSMLISRGTPSCPDHEKQMQKQMRSKPNLRKQSGDAGAAATALTHRERQILRLVSEGLSNKEIGRRLKVTDGKIKVHLHNIFEKLQITSDLSWN